MAYVSCSFSLSKKFSNAADVSLKHIYDDVFSAPPATKLNASTISFDVDEYREIFSPSNSSPGSSPIPFLELPAVDRGDVVGRTRSSGVDYAGVFGGTGDDSRIGVPGEEIFRKSKKKARRASRTPRSSTQKKTPDSKNQEFSGNFGNKGKTKSPAKTRITPSESQGFCGSSGNNQTSTSDSSDQALDSTKHFNISHHKTDDTNGVTQIAHLHAVPGNTSLYDEVGLVGTSGFDNAKHMSMDDTDVSLNADKVKRQGKHTREVSDFGTEQTCDYDAGLKREFGGGECRTLDASCGTQQAYKKHTHLYDEVGPLEKSVFDNAKHLSMDDIDVSIDADKVKGQGKHTRAVSDLGTEQACDCDAGLQREFGGVERCTLDASCCTQEACKSHARLYDEVGPSEKSDFDNAKHMSTDDTDVCMGADKLKRQGKHTRAVSDLGTEHACDYDAGLQRGSGGSECCTLDASCGPHKSQTCSVSTTSSSPQLFGSNDYYFRRTSSKRSKSSPYNQQTYAAADSSSPLLDEELDENSAAAVSVAAMKRAIEEAEAIIRRAKDFMKRQDLDGSIKLTFKDSFKVKITSDLNHSYEARGLNQNGPLKVEAMRQNKRDYEDKAPTQKDNLNIKATSENNDSNEAGGSKMKAESQHADKADGLKVTWHGVAAQVDTASRKSIGEETHEFLNDVELEDKKNSHKVLKSAEKSQKPEGGGEWEAAKHLSRLISGVKNRFVNFISKEVDTEKIGMQADGEHTSRSPEQSDRSAFQVQDADAHMKMDVDQEHLEMDHCATSGVGESAQDSNRAGTQVHEPEQNELKRRVALEWGKVEEFRVYPDHKMLSSEQCGPSEPEEQLENIEVQETSEVELTKEDVQDQSREFLDDCVRWEYGKSQMDRKEPEEHDVTLEATYHSRGYDPKEETNCTDNNETGKAVQVQESVEKGIDNPFNGEDVNWKLQGACSWVEAEMPKVSKKKLEDVERIEETSTEELQERVQAAELSIMEDNETIEHQDANSKAAIGLIVVADDTFELDENLASADNVCEHDESLFLSKNKEASMHNEGSQHAQNVEFSIEEKERMGESPTSTVEPKLNVEQPSFIQIANQSVQEDMCEQTQCSLDAADDALEHDDYRPTVDDTFEQDEQSILSINEASGHCDRNQYPLEADFTFEKERMADSTNTTSETKGNLEQPSSVHTADEFIGKEMCGPPGCSIELVDETLDHGECPASADNVCNKEEHSCLNRNDEGYGHEDGNQGAQDVKFCFTDERMTESAPVTSEPEWNVEQLSAVHRVPKLSGEEMTETSTSAGDIMDFGGIEEIKDFYEVLSHTNIQKTQRETDLNFEEKHAGQETYTCDIGPETQVDESEVRKETGEVDIISDQDKRMHDTETSNKRKRWFENKDEVGEFHRTGILLGGDIILDLDQDSAEGSKVDDRVESHVDEMVNESGVSTNVRHDDTCSGLEDGHSTETTHRRRRWFENREVLHKRSAFDGAGTALWMDDKIAQESKLDDNLQSGFDKLVKERKERADLRECDMVNDQLESRRSAEVAHRRRRWFENREKLGPAQRPSVLEDNGTNADQEEEIEIGADNAKHDERAVQEARQKAFAEAQEKAAVEEHEKAAATAQDRQGKASPEANSGSVSDKSSIDEKIGAEHAAVEREAAEPQDRALQKAMSKKATCKSREKDPKNQTSDSCTSSACSSVPLTTEKSSGAMSEPPLRRKAISERNRRTMERAAKALEEKKRRDLLVQKEHAERNRFAEALDADIKRWLTGKEGNLRALLSTLQYILGPESGWQPIPLTELVTSTAVRKAYKRAAMCVHPDKLQQRGATIKQKYISEKVFDLLKDAWHKFNPDDQ